MVYPYYHRADRTIDLVGEDSELAGPATVVGHHGQITCQLIRKRHPASLSPASTYVTTASRIGPEAAIAIAKCDCCLVRPRWPSSCPASSLPRCGCPPTWMATPSTDTAWSAHSSPGFGWR